MHSVFCIKINFVLLFLYLLLFKLSQKFTSDYFFIISLNIPVPLLLYDYEFEVEKSGK